MISRLTCSATLALSCAVLAACSETATDPEPVPVSSNMEAGVFAAAISFSQISAGSVHTCGLTPDQRLYCWGWNFMGQLGDGTGETRTRPVPVGGALRFRQVNAGGDHTCAITPDDLLYCWGGNAAGQLGDGTKNQHSSPTLVAGGQRFRTVTASGSHTCAIRRVDNRAYCWGYNSAGQLGDGTTTDRLTPTQVRGSMQFREVSAGDRHTCGVTTASRAFCWGENRYGQTGDSTVVLQRLTPTRVATGRTFRQIDAGIRHTCAVAASDSRVFCWGEGRQGQLGHGGRFLSRWPRATSGGLTFDRVTAGMHTCGETTSNRAYCWGDNFYGGLGDGTTTTRLTPVAVKGNLFFSQLSAGEGHTCGRTAESKAYCWGRNEVGQVGDGTFNPRLTPTPVAGP